MAIDLVTLAEYKSYIGITNPSEDVVLSALITKVSAFVKRYCRRTFVDYVDEARTDTFSGGTNFQFKEYPVLTIPDVSYSDDFGKTYTTLVEYQDYIFNQSTEELEFLIAPYNISTSKANRFKITYTAGFEEIPEDLKLAVFDLIKYYYRNDGAVHSERSPGSNTVQIDYVTSNALPAHISRVLKLHQANYA